MTYSSTCLRCGESLYRDDIHCPKCGLRRADSVLDSAPVRGATRAIVAISAAGEGDVPVCSACGASRLSDDIYCPGCGVELTEESPRVGRRGEGEPLPPPAQEDAPEETMDGWQEVQRQLEDATKGEFEVLRELGRGGMAAVYLARDLALDRNVAIKVMAPGLLMGQGMVDRFRQEAVTIANLHHPNIITIHTVRQAGNLHFFVMQEVQGGSLEDVLERSEMMPVALVQAILYQIGTGLAHAHANGVIHRDIKPANVLLDSEGNAILTDFGIAKVTTASNLTQTGSTIGTPSYMSPEQCRAAELSDASDQYSLGIVAYEMLVGRAPFSGSPFEIMQAHTSAPPPPIREERPDCPPELEAAVMIMLAKDPAQRFPGVAEAIEAIGGYLPGPRDPLRRELARLVRSGAPERTEGREALTPLPSRTPVPTPVREEAAARSGKGRLWRKPLLIGGILGAFAVGVLAVNAFLPEGTAPPAEPEPEVVGTARVAAIVLPEAPEAILVGGSVRIVAGIQDPEGRGLSQEPVNWTSSDPSVASVEGGTEEVLVTGIAPGTATIQAEAGGMVASFRVEVSPPAVGELTVSTPRRELPLGSQIALTAILTDEAGEPVPDPDLAWSSGDPGIAEVDPSTGMVTARGMGRTEITVVAGERRGSVALRVVGIVEDVSITRPDAPVTVGAIVVVRASVTSRPDGYFGEGGVAWRSSNSAVATVSLSTADSAVLTLLAEGETVLTARAGTAEDALTLRVLPPERPVSLNLSVASVNFDAVEGGEAPEGQSVGVQVRGDASPSVGAVEYEGDGRGWLRVDLGARAGETAVLTLDVVPANLSEGSYLARVPVAAGSESRILEVLLDVAANPGGGALEANQVAEQGITALLADYASAINSKNSSRVLEIFPSLTQGDLNDLLALRDTDTYLLQLVPGTLRLGTREETLDADVMSSVLGRGEVGEARRWVYSFARGARGWYLVSLRPAG